jgi:hypothetical protein
MIFGHLKAEDFTNLLEGATLTGKRQDHLQSCAKCLKKFESVQEIRNQIEKMRVEADEYIPEPDWSEFRSDVRDALLSRSVKRESVGRSWLAELTWRPTLAWGVTMLLVFGLAFDFVWNHRDTEPDQVQVADVEDTSAEAELNLLAAMSEPDPFDDLVQLDADEAENLQRILNDMARESVRPQ